MRFCKECHDKKVCIKCNDQINENKDFGDNLNELKRHAPNHFGYMLPYYRIEFSTFCTKPSIM